MYLRARNISARVGGLAGAGGDERFDRAVVWVSHSSGIETHAACANPQIWKNRLAGRLTVTASLVGGMIHMANSKIPVKLG